MLIIIYSNKLSMKLPWVNYYVKQKHSCHKSQQMIQAERK